ncbi:centrosomal protein 76kDa [Trypanosoma conorhini]|uniref:Centrosomal protein 76kDa n=1 Tax=Trypanosoma conorhini TaxID=83891 RepID=A0A3R7PB31_9TRYP|nr:centrosomal protein 76kDa [Trypanosoma conorhini]RNF20659.1 centrosomal protein 76kDa [Trypanosoma conorhini]
MAADPSQLNGERLKELRGAVHTFLQESSVYSKIRDIVDSYVSENPGDALNPTSSADVMKIIREKGLVQDLLDRLHGEKHLSLAQTLNAAHAWKLLPGQYYLHLRLAGGKAFVDNLDLSPSFAKDYLMYVAVQFGSQRYRSTSEKAAVDPPFRDEFLIDLDYKSFGSCAADLIQISTPLHIAVFGEERLLTCAKMLGENLVDWRRVLRTGYLGLTVELCGDNPGIPAGILELQLELLPNKAPRFSEEDVASRIDLQRSAITSADREFLLYARRWWMEFQEIRPIHKQRKVKVFASTSNGRMVPTTHFVSVIRAENGIDTPAEAARFVSLIAVTDEEHLTQEVLLGGLGNNSSRNCWLSMFTFLSQRRGEPCNHAALLCSLLLGFGLDAYCAVGTNKKGTTIMFVVSRKRLNAGVFEVLLWEPTSGNRFTLTDAHQVETLGSVFNHRSFYANIQPSDIVTTISFDFDNEELWKPLTPLKLRMVPKYPNPSLLWIPIDTKSLEEELVTSLITEITEYRDIRGVITLFDEALAYVLRQVLCAYEGHRRNGAPEDLSLFENCVKGVIGEGKTFKGVPVNVTHLNSRKILAAFESSASGKEILELTADNLNLAVQVKIFSFPEAVLSVWVILAAAYASSPA